MKKKNPIKIPLPRDFQDDYSLWIIRGGFWGSFEEELTVSQISIDNPSPGKRFIGFRICRTTKSDQ